MTEGVLFLAFVGAYSAIGLVVLVLGARFDSLWFWDWGDFAVKWFVWPLIALVMICHAIKALRDDPNA